MKHLFGKQSDEKFVVEIPDPPRLSGKMIDFGGFLVLSTNNDGSDGIWGPFDTVDEAKGCLRMMCGNQSIFSAVIIHRTSLKKYS